VNRTIAPSLCALALLCAAAGAQAQTIYKQVDLEGRTIYTDRPDASLSAQSITSSPLAAPAPPAGITLMALQRSAAINASEARRRLAQAQVMRSQGADVLPGEQTSAAPNQRYWQRQEKLRVLVERAQQRVNETQLPLLAQH
jgi:hypothetical protein